MSKIPFDEKELRVVGETPNRLGGGTAKLFDTPVSLKEGAVDCYKNHDPIWIPTGVEAVNFCPSIQPDNIARGFVIEGHPWPEKYTTYKDMFGVEWVFVDQVGGAMVKPGSPMLEDISQWRDVVKFPNIDEWDWEGSAEANKEFLSTGKANVMMLLNGCWFERLISFMDFEGAAMALIDEDDVEYVKELTHEMTSLYLHLIDLSVKYYPLDGICIHDDWGSQMAPFFSENVAREVYLPEMKRFVEHVHSKGLYCELHSCGHNESRIQVFVDAGFDAWTPMDMNNTVDLYERFGDKIAIGVINDRPFDPETATEEEQRASAREFAERFCKPGTFCSFSHYNRTQLTDAFREELYKASRIAYSRG